MTDSPTTHLAGDRHRPDDRGAAALAALARRSLTDAPAATLFVDRAVDSAPGRRTATEPVVLGERCGRPVLLCAPGSHLALAARDGCPAVLSVPLPACSAPGGSAVFAGALAVTGHCGTGDDEALEVELQLASIHLEVADTPPQPVPLGAYRLGSRDANGTDALTEAADRLRVHANEQHGDRLRAFVADQLEVPPAVVAAASLGALDDSGARLDWVDDRGAHQLLLPFTTPPRDQRELADALREQLVR